MGWYIQPALNGVLLIKNSNSASQPTSELAVYIVTIPRLLPSEMSAGGEQGVGGGDGREEDQDKVGGMSRIRIHFAQGTGRSRMRSCNENGAN